MQAGGLIWSSRSSNKVGLKFWRVRPSFVRKASKEVIFFPERKEEKRQKAAAAAMKLFFERCYLHFPGICRWKGESSVTWTCAKMGKIWLAKVLSLPPTFLQCAHARTRTHTHLTVWADPLTHAHASAFLSQCLCDTCEICFCRNKLFILLNFYYFSIAAFTWVGFSLSHFISLHSHQHTHNKTH